MRPLPATREASTPGKRPEASTEAIVRRLWAWPVKSMQGQRVDSLRFGRAGAEGDREWAVIDMRPHTAGKPLSARSRPELLQWGARLEAGGTCPVVTDPDGKQWEWSDPRLVVALADRLEMPIRLSKVGDFADLPSSVLLTTEPSHRRLEAELGELDRRRWRSNVHVEAQALAPFEELGWEGSQAEFAAGTVAEVLHPCPRCAVPTWAPDGKQRDRRLLQALLTDFAGVMGMNLRPTPGGYVAVGDEVRVRRIDVSNRMGK